jgi:hypothetical protein
MLHTSYLWEVVGPSIDFTTEESTYGQTQMARKKLAKLLYPCYFVHTCTY